MADETVRVVFATVCSKCESVISEEVRELSYESVFKSHTKNEESFVLYHDRHHRALFRSLTFESGCRSC